MKLLRKALDCNALVFGRTVDIEIQRGSYRTVTQKCTDGFDIGSLLQQASGKGMAERMKMDVPEVQ